MPHSFLNLEQRAGFASSAGLKTSPTWVQDKLLKRRGLARFSCGAALKSRPLEFLHSYVVHELNLSGSYIKMALFIAYWTCGFGSPSKKSPERASYQSPGLAAILRPTLGIHRISHQP